MKTFIVTFLVFLFPLACPGQTLFVFDREDGKPIEHARMLLSDGKKTYVYKESDAAGRIAYDRNKLKNCQKVSIRRMGYKSVEIVLAVPPVLADTVWMEEDGALSTVTVRGERQLYRLEPNRVVYDVSKDSTLRGKTAFEIMQRLPKLIVMNSEKINSYDGKPIVYKINGLSNPVLTGDVMSALQSLPAEAFHKVEIVTDPLTGFYIVNLSTRFRLEGYRIAPSAEVGCEKFSARLWGMTKIRKFTVSGSYANIYHRELSGDTRSEELRYNSHDLYRYIREAHDRGYRADLNNVELSASYDLSDRSLLTFFVSKKLKINPSNSGWQHLTAYDPEGRNTLDLMKRFRSEMDDSETDVQISYEKVYGEEGRSGKLYMGYTYSGRPIMTRQTDLYDALPFTQNLPFAPEDIFDYDRTQKDTENWHTLEAEYRRKWGPHCVEMLAKLRYRDESQDREQHSRYVLCPDVEDKYSYEGMGYRQTYCMMIGSYFYENSRMKARIAMAPVYSGNFYDRKEIDNTFHKSFLNIQPSASFTYQFSPDISGEISYSMTQMNPSINSLNPYVDRNTPGAISYGNIHLKPETTHAFQLSTDVRVRKFFFTFSATGFVRENLISSYFFMKDGVLHNTKGNIVNRYVGQVGAYVFSRLSRSTFITFNNNLNYNKYNSSVLNQSNYGFQYSCSGRLGQDLTDHLYLELGGGYNTPFISLQGRGHTGNHWYKLSLSQYFPKSRCSLSLYASNFVPLRFTRRSSYESEGYSRQYSSRSFQASFGVTFSYRFGKLDAEVKRTEGSIENNDVK